MIPSNGVLCPLTARSVMLINHNASIITKKKIQEASSFWVNNVHDFSWGEIRCYDLSNLEEILLDLSVSIRQVLSRLGRLQEHHEVINISLLQKVWN